MKTASSGALGPPRPPPRDAPECAQGTSKALPGDPGTLQDRPEMLPRRLQNASEASRDARTSNLHQRTPLDTHLDQFSIDFSLISRRRCLLVRRVRKALRRSFRVVAASSRRSSDIAKTLQKQRFLLCFRNVARVASQKRKRGENPRNDNRFHPERPR